MKFLIFILLILPSLIFASDFSTKNKIAELQKKYGGKIGIYTIDNNDNSNFGYNDNFSFPICSVYKFLLVAAILKSDMNKPLLQEKILIKNSDIKNIGYTPITSKYVGKKISIYKLADATIKSDNAAANILLHRLGGLGNLNRFIESLNDKKTLITHNEPSINNVNVNNNFNKTTPKAITRDINKIAFGDNILDKKHQNLFKKWLKDNNTGKNRIAYNIPNNWDIGSKTGTCEYGTTNDVAILWPEHSKSITIAILYTQVDTTAKPNDVIIQKTTEYILQNLKNKKLCVRINRVVNILN